MIRQRINLRNPALAHVAHALTLVLAAILIWYGAMVVLLAAKVSPHTVNSLSAYRTLYHDAAGLKLSDFTTVRRLVIGCAGFLAFLVFVYLALQTLPRPYLARGPFAIGDREHGATTVAPRAVERALELAAAASPRVTAAVGRLGDEKLELHIHVRSARSAADDLRDVHGRAVAALAEHGLPAIPVNVTLTGYDRKTTRELS